MPFSFETFAWAVSALFQLLTVCAYLLSFPDVDGVDDPQDFDLELQVNGETRQDSSTARQIFPVAAVVEFIASFVTLEPGDVISTGTPAGVGNTTKTFLRPGDKLRASISRIGVLENHIVG